MLLHSSTMLPPYHCRITLQPFSVYSQPTTSPEPSREPSAPVRPLSSASERDLPPKRPRNTSTNPPSLRESEAPEPSRTTASELSITVPIAKSPPCGGAAATFRPGTLSPRYPCSRPYGPIFVCIFKPVYSICLWANRSMRTGAGESSPFDFKVQNLGLIR